MMLPDKVSKLLGWIVTLLSMPWSLIRKSSEVQFARNRTFLQNKVVLITGASSGIGEALAHKLYAHGCRLILMSRRIDELNRVKKDLLATPQKTPTHIPQVLPLDLMNIKEIPSCIDQALNIYGQIDILINNAGIGHRGLVIDTDIAVYMKVMTTNFFGQVTVTKAVLHHMKDRMGGHLVFVSSLQAKVTIPCRSAYGASKHAILTFGDSLRAEVEKYNIKVSMICPSYVRTSLSKNALTSTGAKHGKIDSSTQQGDDPEMIAEDVIDCVINEKKEITCGPLLHRLLYYMRVLLPTLYFKVLLILEKDKREQLT